MSSIKPLDIKINQRVNEIVNRCQLTLQVQQRQLQFVENRFRRDESNFINKPVLLAQDHHYKF
jgi:hypothetical protein